jgi:hypothetical protein
MHPRSAADENALLVELNLGAGVGTRHDDQAGRVPVEELSQGAAI